MIRLRQLSTSVAAIAVAVVLAAGAAAQDRALSKDPIRLSVGVDPAFSAIYYAKQEKLFEKHGINLQVVQFTQGGDGVDALVANQVEMSSTAESTVLTRSLRADIRLVTIFSESGKFIKFVARKGIDDIKQVKKFGIVPGSVSELSTVLLLAKLGIEEKSIELIRGAPPEFPALLARGDVDGYFMWEPWPSNGVKQGGKILMNSGDVGYVYNMMITANFAWISTHKPEIKAFIAALDEACKALVADPSRIGKAVQAEVKLPAAQANELAKDVEWKVRKVTADDIARYKQIAAFQVARKIAPRAADIDKIVQSGLD